MRLFLAAASLLVVASAQQGSDYITEAPPTVYEAEEMSPQNMDFDRVNNMFVAHSGWYNDQLIHYYKFRMYTPGTYPGVSQAPIQNIHYMTTTGGFDGVVGKPIIEYHTADGIDYSDFMQVNFITVGDDYEADTYKSVGDVVASGMTPEPTTMILNLPVVPTGAMLQDPHGATATSAAPISPTPVWYKGVEVWTYVFEVTDESAKAYFDQTREDPEDFAYAVTKTSFATPEAVNAIPLWHVNQFSNGVQEGVNGGGPSPMGMRNVINLDRPDAGYSPLWLINWVTELPIDYEADEASNAATMTSTMNGFEFVSTPMLVNCPDIGNVSALLNDERTVHFQTAIDPQEEDNMIMGSHMSLIMQGGVAISIQTQDGVEIGTTETNMMGAYEYDLESVDLPAGTTEIMIVIADGEETILRTVPVVAGSAPGEDYIDMAPATVYEAEEMSPQNMDFDKENNMFLAHSGWYNDRLVHYYKFRMYTPGTYPDIDQVPIQNIYYMTTTGGFDGVVGKPIIEYHTADGVDYSDFMQVHFMTVDMDYEADTYKSVGDVVVAAGITPEATTMILNLPVVPTGATLQDPERGGTAKAPISPTLVWYRGVQVWTYVFEVTDESAKEYFDQTREDPEDFAYAVTTTNFATPDSVNAIPLWHVNQFSAGVEEGVNGGGPSPMGMRNIINLDRPDAGYSPLWLINWVTELPINYKADQVSNAASMTMDNGFSFVGTPMFVNCPDIGNVGEMVNDAMIQVDNFQTQVDLSQLSNMILGSHMSLIMQGGVKVSFETAADGGGGGMMMIGSTETNMMGAYEYKLRSNKIPADTTEILVLANGETIRTLTVQPATGSDYIDETPPTVYESEEMTPQNMDFDKDNNMFVAHSGWYDDHLVHYYKFRMYTPATYPPPPPPDDDDPIIVTPQQEEEETNGGGMTTTTVNNNGPVPMQMIYMVTTTGDFTGVMGNPILEYHQIDGTLYSDFMEVVFVEAPPGYVADTFKSKGDIMDSSSTRTNSGIILNIPVVPTGSTLQDPEMMGMKAAPISPTLVWYKGVEVWTYVFEVTDESAKTYFDQTRDDPEDFAYAITATPFATTAAGVNAIPLWHINQFTSGVEEGVNGGGPSPLGMRNVINLDRPDPGYSPLWLINWGTELPVNYKADEASNADTMTSDNGFAFVTTPMFVNCPDIGSVVMLDKNAPVVNDKQAMTDDDDFQTVVDLNESSNKLIGSHMSLIMQAGVPVTFETQDGEEIATVTTNMMGGYEFLMRTRIVPAGTTEINVMVNGESIRTLEVIAAAKEGGDDDEGSSETDEEETSAAAAAFSRIQQGAFMAGMLSLVAALLL